MRLLLADDHTLVRQGLMPFFKALDPEVEVIEASCFDTALEAARTQGPLDLILLDLRMPGMLGTRGIDMMVAAFPKTPVVILSGSVEASDVVGAIDHGAAGYLPKTLSSTAMINALRLVLSGEKYFPSFAFNAPRPVAASPAAPFADGNPLAALDERERTILGMVVDGRTNKEIARVLDLQEVTIKVQTRNIYRKLNAANRSQAVRIAMENGWKSDQMAE
ncbi:MAG: response regulator transcription factor [Rhodospirillaceae bacterium]